MVSYEWVCETNGVLTRAERSIVRTGMRRFILETIRGIVTRSKNGTRSTTTLFPSVPDTEVASTAIEMAKNQGVTLLFHGYRTWLLGTALSQVDQTSVDSELLFVTSLLHDSGMLVSVPGEDFTRRSADNVLDVFDRAGAPRRRALQAADAVVAHATPGLEVSTDTIGYYVQCGAMADLAGIRRWHLPPGAINQAYALYPSHDIHRTLSALARRNAEEVLDSRLSVLVPKPLSNVIRLALNFSTA
ncbi:hypothetical protein [Amycolatopsis sp. FDAARGOS 1241]|uniref:hypothetical protein n=1 Tax=Amycolatopsis sp. FDAARGOS 1241 TaxID=2778070 RepID=UPI00194DDB5D|nr:hypothetical protein [Amycolatopsis sp. FDAARGOS 1241]QRP42706.1 hypothetical protein I6J71_24770 [Amycolatopsis sp. FDAARGOS 1241]